MASPAAVLSVLVKAEGIAQTNRQLQSLHGGLDKSSRVATKMGDDLDKSSRKGAKALGALKSSAGLAVGALGVTGLVGALGSAIDEFRESQKVGAQTNAVLKSTGGVANVTAKHVGDLATAISRKAGIDDEAIQSGANLLLTFKGVRNEVGKGNDIFDQATQTITDMSVSLKQGLKPSAIQVGKALNDPVKGITALSRVGVTFTEGQKKMIAGLVKSGDTLGAQKIILKELRSEFGGSAEAAATAGDKLKVSVGNLAEAAGAILVPALDKVARLLSALFDGMVQNKGIGGAMVSTFKSIASVVGTVATAIASLVGWFQKHTTVAEALGAALGVVLAAFLAFTASSVVAAVPAAIEAITVAMFELNAVFLANPVVLVIAALAALAAGLVVAYKKSETFRNIVNAAWQAVKDAANALWDVIKVVFPAIGNAIVATWGAIKTATITVWNAIKVFLIPLWELFKTLVSTYFTVYKTIIVGVWDAVKTVTTTVWGAIKTVLTTAWSVLQTLATSAWGAIKVAILNPIRDVRDALGGKDGIWARIKDTASKAWSDIKDGVGGFARGVASGVENAFEGATNKVIDFANKIIDVVNKVPGVPNIGHIAHIGGGGGTKGPHISPDKKAKGGTLVPGTGSGDRVPLHIGGRLAAMVEPGELVSVANRNATAALMGVNSAIPRFQGGGLLNMAGNAAGSALNLLKGGAKGFLNLLPSPGDLPSWLSGLGKYVLGKVSTFIKDKASSALASLNPFGASGKPGGGGTSIFDGRPVANWIVPILKWARSHGWGGSVTSGYRTPAQQMAAAINYGLEHYGPGGPLASNHVRTAYPGGAVDVTAASQLAAVLSGYRGARRLIWAGPTIGDFVHFSANGRQRGGVIGGLPFLGTYHQGGIAPREGLAHVSAGERMTPAGQGGPLVNIEHAEFGSQIDVNSFAAKLGFKLATT